MFRRREGRGTDQSNETRFITNLTNKVITLGDIDNLEISPNQRLDLLKFASIQRIGSSVNLKMAINAGWIRFEDRDGRRVKKNKAKKAIIPAVLRDIFLGGLTDVVIADLSDNDLLQYDAGSEKWVNKEPTEVDINLNVATITSNYAVPTENDVILCDASDGDIIVTLPLAVNLEGKEYSVKKTDSSENEVTVQPGNTETIDGSDTQIISNQYDNMQIVANNGDWYIL